MTSVFQLSVNKCVIVTKSMFGTLKYMCDFCTESVLYIDVHVRLLHWIGVVRLSGVYDCLTEFGL